MKSKPNILFTSTFLTPFISSDLNSLKECFPVVHVNNTGLGAIMSFIKEIPRADLTFTWFASTYSAAVIFLGKLFNKKSILILGGVDVAREKDLNYGIWNSRWKSVLVKYAVKNADAVLAVDDSLKQQAAILCRYNGGNISVLPTGYDPAAWKVNSKKEDIVLTVAACNDMRRIKIKGIDFLIKAAGMIPEIKFLIVGISKNLLPQLDLPKNVTAAAAVPHLQLNEYYSRAKVYFQPSFREGLPNTLCEAMLCECIPVGTKAGGIPGVIGNTGLIINYGDTDAAADAIKKAFKMDTGTSARQRIIEKFSKAQREKELFSLINSMVNE